jgi:phage terminase large subunit-like protein
MFNAGNQLGKSDAGAYETACHVTGIYPEWWTGLRFDKPILAWACGLTADKTMGINQLKLCGKPNTPDTLGTGLIPKSCFVTDPVLGRGTTGAFASVAVKHASGGYSTLAFKSYEQGWQKFQGDGVSFIWLDEEPDDFKVYTECQARLLATGGSMMITFTPLQGETELYQSFARGDDPDKGFVNMTGDDVLAEPHGHLTGRIRPCHQQLPRPRAGCARSGRPVMGSGAIFQIMRETIEIPPITNLSAIGAWDGASTSAEWVG